MKPPSENGQVGLQDAVHESTPLVHDNDTFYDAIEGGGVGGDHPGLLHFDGLSKAVAAAAHPASIGFLGSLAIAVNDLTGPAMVQIPATYQSSGLIPTTVALIFVCVLSSLCSLHMANTISKVEGNFHFDRNIEFSEAFHLFWGNRWYMATQVVFFLCVTCLNISSIVDTAQVVDTFVGHWASTGSMAVELDFSLHGARLVQWNPLNCTSDEIHGGECIPFRQHSGTLLTLGYIITVAIFLPLALMDLKENAVWQVAAFVVLILTSIMFCIEFIMAGSDVQNLSLWGDSWDALLGVVLFNFALVIAIPAWLTEKSSSVHVPTIVWGSTGLAAVLYIFCGILGAMAIPNVSRNMLESMMSGAFGTAMQIGSTIFAFMIIGLGIPLFSVLTRMNLTGSGLCSQAVGNALAVYLPFGISWMLYQGDAVTQLLAWGGVLFTSGVAFILPLMLALHTVLDYDAKGVIQIYGGWFESPKSQRNALIVLLGLASLSVVCAIAGLIMAGTAPS